MKDSAMKQQCEKAVREKREIKFAEWDINDNSENQKGTKEERARAIIIIEYHFIFILSQLLIININIISIIAITAMFTLGSVVMITSKERDNKENDHKITLRFQDNDY